MCLGIPGELVAIDASAALAMGEVAFGGIRKRVCLACVPEAQVGDHVIVHAGFAIAILDEQAASEVFGYLEQLGDLDELGEGP